MYEAIIEFCERNEVDFNRLETVCNRKSSYIFLFRKTPDFKRRDMLIVNKTLSEVGFICDDYNGFTDDKEEEVAKVRGANSFSSLKI